MRNRRLAAPALRLSCPAAFAPGGAHGARNGKDTQTPSYCHPSASRVALETGCPTLLVGGENEPEVRASNAAHAALMPHAIARFVPGLGHAWFGWRHDLHVAMVEAFLTGQDLPEGLVPEPPSPSAVARVLRRIERSEASARHRPGWQSR